MHVRVRQKFLHMACKIRNQKIVANTGMCWRTAPVDTRTKGIAAQEAILREIHKARDRQDACLANERSQSTFVTSTFLAITSLIITIVELPRILNSQVVEVDYLKTAARYLIILTLAFLVLASIYYRCDRLAKVLRWLGCKFRCLMSKARAWLQDAPAWSPALASFLILVVLTVVYPTWFTWLTNPNIGVIRYMGYALLYTATLVVGSCWVYVHRVTGRRGKWQVGPNVKELTALRDGSNGDQAALLDSLIRVHSERFAQNEEVLHHVRKITATQMLIVYITILVLATVISFALQRELFEVLISSNHLQQNYYVQNYYVETLEGVLNLATTRTSA